MLVPVAVASAGAMRLGRLRRGSRFRLLRYRALLHWYIPFAIALDQPVLGGPKIPLHASFGLRRMRRDPRDSQFLQGAADLRRRHFYWVFVHSRLIASPLLRCSEQARLVPIERQRPAELLHITPQQFQVLLGRIVPHTSRQ